MDDITKAEIERIHDEDTRQNKRLEKLEESVGQLTELVLNIQRLTISVESLTKEVQKQGERVEKLESKPAEAWSTMQRTLFTTIVSAVGGGLAVGFFQVIVNGMK